MYVQSPITYYTKLELKSMPNANEFRNQIEHFLIIDNFVNEHQKKKMVNHYRCYSIQ